MNNINILLVDDEVVDLEWLRRRVLNSKLPIDVAGTANSGFAALKLMEDKRIDIIFSDLRMPIMSGIDFARKAKEINPRVKIVFISGHEDFGYAKEAIQINAYRYLLKPVEDAELYETLEMLCESVNQEREQDRTATETMTLVNQELLLRWFEEPDNRQIEALVHKMVSPLLQTGTAAALIEPDDLAWKLRDVSEDERRQAISNIEYFLSRFVRDNQLGTLIKSHNARFVLLAAVDEQRFIATLEQLIVAIRQTFTFTITVGTGMYAFDMIQLHESYLQAEAALNAKWLIGKNRLIRDVSEWCQHHAAAANMEESVGRMLQAILDYDLVKIDDCLLELFNRDMQLTRRNDVYDLIIRITSKLHADLQLMNENLYELLKWESHQPDVLFQFETIHDILSWLRKRFFELSELLLLKRQRQNRKLIEEIMRYVEEKLEQKVTLKEVAARFDFTPNYLGHLFKEESGLHFSDFLNEKRMKRVCDLLMDPTFKIYEIADRVGYKNIIYFNRQFKQSTGMTPGEYRKKHKI